MIGQGSGLHAGGLMNPLPVPSGVVRYNYDPYAKNRHATSPFRDASGNYLPIKTTPKPKPVKVVAPKPVKVAKPKVKKEPYRRKGTVPRDEVPRIKAAREYLATPKNCAYCGEEFSARPNERIDGYRRRTTCNRSHAYQLRFKEEGS